MANKILETDEEVIIRELTYNSEELSEEVEAETEKPRTEPDTSEWCKIVKDGFGICPDYKGDGDCKVVHRFTLTNKNNITVQIITYGATIISIKTPDKDSRINDIVLGFENLEGYRNQRNPYFGATIGRITGVIPQELYTLIGNKYYVTNNFMETLHANGGFVGFDKVVWNAHVSDGKLILSYMSRDKEEGFPGDIVINRSYELTVDNELKVETSAHCSKPTPLEISTHVDWNLSSHIGGSKELYKHYLLVNADKYAQVNKATRMMTGKLKRVDRTSLDLRIPRPLGRIIHRVPGGGYDHYMNLIRGPDKHCVTFAARLIHPDSGRFVEVMTDQSGVLVYTQNNLYAEKFIIAAHPVSCWCHDPLLLLEQKLIQNPVDSVVSPQRKDNICNKLPEVYGPIRGKFGANYRRHGGIRLVPVNYPESVSRHYNFNTFVLRPGQTYHNTTIYKFGNIFDRQYDPLGQCPWNRIVM